MMNFETFLLKERHFWGKFGAGILVHCESTGRFLLSFRSSLVNEPHTYGIIGGKVDDEENVDLKKEALRELEEETGYTGEIKLSDLSVFEAPNFAYYTFLGVIEKEYKPVSHPDHAWENDHFRWVTYQELLNLEPKHFGLEYIIDNYGDRISEL